MPGNRRREIEERLEAHFQEERRGLRAPLEMWARLEPRLGAQDAGGARSAGASWRALRGWLQGAPAAYAGAVAVLLLLVGGVATWRAVAPGQTETGTREAAGPGIAAPAGPQGSAGADGSAMGLAVPGLAPGIAALGEQGKAMGWLPWLDQSHSAGGVELAPLAVVAGGGGHAVLVYALVAPQSLSGWRLAPGRALVTGGGPEGPWREATGVVVAVEGAVTIGAVPFHLPEAGSAPVWLRMEGMVATSAAAGQERLRELSQAWEVGLLSPGEAAGPGGPWLLLLRSEPCFAAAGVTVDLAGGAGCGEGLRGQQPGAESSVPAPDLAAGQVRLTMVGEGQPRTVSVGVGPSGEVSVARE